MSTPPPTDILDVASLRSAIAEGWSPSYLFFWGHQPRKGALGKYVLSQWWRAPFTMDDQIYATAEHYMMSEKARLFADAETLARILASDDPREAKEFGRQVRGFDPQRWERHCVEVAVRGNTAKFTQNSELGAWLLSTADTVLVEASPVDTVWGIGLAADDPRAKDPAQWRGINLLGFALMRVRTFLHKTAK